MHASELPSTLCLECGYDLRSLSSDRCPECGVSFDRSQHAAKLAVVRSRYAWIRLGCRYLTLAGLTFVACAILSIGVHVLRFPASGGFGISCYWMVDHEPKTIIRWVSTGPSVLFAVLSFLLLRSLRDSLRRRGQFIPCRTVRSAFVLRGFMLAYVFLLALLVIGFRICTRSLALFD